MIKIIVRSRKDARAVKAVLERFPETMDMKVVSLGGVRGEKIVEKVEEILEPFSIILIGKEDYSIVPLLRDMTREVPFTTVIPSKTKKIRNNTVEMIHALITKGRAEIRLTSYWKDTYILSNHKYGQRIPIPIEPYADTFFLFGRGSKLALDIMGIENSRTPPLLMAVKLALGEHIVFAGPNRIGSFRANNRGLSPKGVAYSDFIIPESVLGKNINDIIPYNENILKILEYKSFEVLAKIEEPDTVIVPLSGGKDSATALILAVKHFGKDVVKGVYVDTGIDFMENEEFARKIAEKLGIDLYIARAGVDRGLLLEGMPMPDPRNRWCTGRKLDALRHTIKKISKGKTIIIVGDRDAESDRRSRRPSIREDDKLHFPTVAPIKLWSGVHVEAYLAFNGIDLNPLYELGFYRTGCYVCFALRDWEIEAMKRGGVIDRIIRARPEHEKLIRRFLGMRVERKGDNG